MSAPFNGWQAAVSIQRETVLNGASSEPVQTLAGKVRLTQSAEFVGKGRTVNVWRTPDVNYFAGKFFRGSLEIELGFNDVIRLLLSGLFELKTQTTIDAGAIYGEGGPIYGEGDIPILGEGGTPIISYEWLPTRLGAVYSFKLGVDYQQAGAPTSVLFSGVVVDSIRFDIRRNQVPKASINFKSVDRDGVTSPALAGATTPDVNRAHHVESVVTLDGNAVALAEINLTFNQPKTPTRFNVSKQPTRFAFGNFDVAGQLVERDGPDAVISDAVLDQAEHGLVFVMTDPANDARKIEFHVPRMNFDDSLPDMLAREDLIARGSFVGLMATDEADSPKIVLVV